MQGRVIDKESRKSVKDAIVQLESIKDANAQLQQASWQARSTEKGQYQLPPVAAGHYRVRVEHPEYNPLVLADIEISPGRVRQLDFELEKIAAALHEKVTVVGAGKRQKPEEPVSRFGLDLAEISRIPNAAEDISRILNIVPSVARINELSNDLIVRGGSPFENGFYIDNIPVTAVNFFQHDSGSGGVVGIINPDFIEASTFFTGAFPARYGDRLSSIIDIRFREGLSDRIHETVDLNASGFSLAAEGPWLDGHGTFHFSIRRSYLDLLAKALGVGIAPRYGDLHGKVTWAPSDRDRLELLLIYGDCAIDFDLARAVANGYNSFLQSQSRQWVAGFNWHRIWNAGSDSQTSLSLSGSTDHSDLYQLGSDTVYRALQDREAHLQLRHLTRIAASPTLSLEGGGDLQPLQSDFNNYYAADINRLGIPTPSIIFQGDFRGLKAGLFFSLAWQPLRSLTCTFGGRADYFSFSRRLLPSPRLNFSFSLSPRFSISAGLGRYWQNLYPQLLAHNPAAQPLLDPSAFQAVLGLEYHPRQSLVASLEFYTKAYRHFPLSPDDPALFVIDNGAALTGFHNFTTIVDSGAAYSRGIEFFLHQTLAGRFFAVVSASLSRYRYRDLNGAWHDRIYDNRFTVTLVVGFKPTGKWNFSLRWNWAGGPPYTPYDTQRSQALGFGVTDETRIDEARYPDFHSLLLRADRFFTFKHSRLSVYLNVNNAYNRKNVARYYWSVTEQKLAAVYQPRLLPIFGIQYEF